MGEMGKIKPGFHEGDETRLWTVPVLVFHEEDSRQLAVTAIYEDEGYFCIDVREQADSD